EGLDIGANEAAAFRRFLDEDAVGSAARQRLEAERPGAREQVEDAHALEMLRIAMGDDVEHRLAGAIGRRADGAGTRCRQHPPTHIPANDPHRLPPSSLWIYLSPRGLRGPEPGLNGRPPAGLPGFPD